MQTHSPNISEFYQQRNLPSGDVYLRCLSWAFSISSLALTEVSVSTVFLISFSKEYSTQLAAPTGNEFIVFLNVLIFSNRASICKHLCKVLKFSNHSDGNLMLKSVTSASKACFYFPTDNNMGKEKAGSFLYRILPLIIQIRVIQTSNCARRYLQKADLPTASCASCYL